MALSRNFLKWWVGKTSSKLLCERRTFFWFFIRYVLLVLSARAEIFTHFQAFWLAWSNRENCFPFASRPCNLGQSSGIFFFVSLKQKMCYGARFSKEARLPPIRACCVFWENARLVIPIRPCCGPSCWGSSNSVCISIFRRDFRTSPLTFRAQWLLSFSANFVSLLHECAIIGSLMPLAPFFWWVQLIWNLGFASHCQAALNRHAHHERSWLDILSWRRVANFARCRPSLLYMCSVSSVCLCAAASLRAIVELTLLTFTTPLPDLFTHWGRNKSTYYDEFICFHSWNRGEERL
jgi:hypothetical protein